MKFVLFPKLAIVQSNCRITQSHCGFLVGICVFEAVYAPKAGATREDAEDDGYVVTVVTNSRDWSSHCLVFDATDVAAGPMARVALPQRVPFGFHASWAPGI